MEASLTYKTKKNGGGNVEWGFWQFRHLLAICKEVGLEPKAGNAVYLGIERKEVVNKKEEAKKA